MIDKPYTPLSSEVEIQQFQPISENCLELESLEGCRVMPTYGHVRGPDWQSWWAGCGPRAASWTTLLYTICLWSIGRYITRSVTLNHTHEQE